jgi:ribosomal protein L3
VERGLVGFFEGEIVGMRQVVREQGNVVFVDVIETKQFVVVVVSVYLWSVNVVGVIIVLKRIVRSPLD